MLSSLPSILAMPSASKAKKHREATLRHAVNVNSQNTPVAAPPAAQTTNGKKKKKKKGKGKEVDVNAAGGQYDDDDDEDGDDVLPALESINGTMYEAPRGRARSSSRTGLTPDLASARLPATETELLTSTEHHFTHNVDTDPDGLINDDYWATFPEHLRIPEHLRNFMRQLSSPGNELQKNQAMVAITQQIHSGTATTGVHVNGNTTVKSTVSRYPPGAYSTSMPFDPSIFADSTFTQAMEQAAAVNGLHLPDVDSAANVVLLDECGEEEQDYGEDGYYSEGEVEEFREQQAQFALRYDEEMSPTIHTEIQTGEKKKNRKKKKRTSGGESQPPRPETPGIGGGEVPEGRPGGPKTAAVTNRVSAVSAPNRMSPAARPPQTANPPPSSRAAGKQPMSYPPAAPSPNPQPPSRRAASKAPITSHAYPPHNHAHHHPSPPSSNASAPHKPRPPAAANGAAQQGKNNKIWSTSTTEERERIKEFWLGLGEDERRNLVKIEKEAVLKKMKEQQKHSCSCAVCGRKRFVIALYTLGKFLLMLRSLIS